MFHSCKKQVKDYIPIFYEGCLETYQDTSRSRIGYITAKVWSDIGNDGTKPLG